MAEGKETKSPESRRGGTSERSRVFTPAASFTIEGSVHDTLSRLATEEWPMFALAEGGEGLVIRSSEVTAVQAVPGGRGRLGFQPS